MGYEAQVAGVGDAVIGKGPKNAVIRMLKSRSVSRVAKFRHEVVSLIKASGHELRFVNGGGMGSLAPPREEEVVTEVTVGSEFYNSHFFDNYKAFKLEPALFYGIQVVRKPRANIFTCHGGGFIASGAVDAIKAPLVYLPKGGQLDPLEGAGEAQTPIRFTPMPKELSIGAPVYLRHCKAGELLERFNEVLLLEDGKIRHVPTYRGLGGSFG
jgi:hypothetical protein